MVPLDHETLNALRRRDPKVLEGLFIETNSYLIKMLGSRRIFGNDAEELVCQTWHTFFEKIEVFEGRSEVKTFLVGILVNKIREFRRSQKRTIHEEDPEVILRSSFSPDGWWHREPEDQAHLLTRKRTSLLIGECLEGLTHNQREAFIMREVDGDDSLEICKILEVSVTNLGVLLFRAKEKLRLCLEGKIALEV